MKLFDKVAIIGTGLIGGSLALGLKRKKLACEIIGVCRHKTTLSLARQRKIIDRGSLDIRIVRDADAVIFATPVYTILRLAERVAGMVREDCIVTDVGSTKQEIVFKLERLFPCYIGSHPLAGSEKRGIVYAQPEIFSGSTCVLTPTGRTQKMAFVKVKRMWTLLGAKVVCMSPASHDQTLSFVSHLPHAVVFSLIDAIPQRFLKFGAGGLKDTTRIAASEDELWADIFMSNQGALLKAIGSFQKNLSELKRLILRKNSAQLCAFLSRARAKREALE